MNAIELCFEMERVEELRQAVVIPACDEHEGHYKTAVLLNWACPVCGGPRGDIKRALSFDGSRRLEVNVWLNPCGHVDYYRNVRQEARTNGLN